MTYTRPLLDHITLQTMKAATHTDLPSHAVSFNTRSNSRRLTKGHEIAQETCTVRENGTDERKGIVMDNETGTRPSK